MGSIEKTDIISVWVCPNCGNYIGSKSMEGQDLNEQMAHDIFGEPTHPRARCPNCGTTRVKRFARLIPQDEVKAAQKRITSAIIAKAGGPVV